jgi:WD40 repeat protein
VVAEFELFILHAAAFVDGGKTFQTLSHSPAAVFLACGGAEVRNYDATDGRFMATVARSNVGSADWIVDPRGTGAIAASDGKAEHCGGYRETPSWLAWPGGKEAVLSGSTGRVRLARFREDAVAFAAGTVVQVWKLTPPDGADRPAQVRIGGYTPHLGEVRALAWSDDGSRLASADTAGKLRAWVHGLDNPPPPVVISAAVHDAADVAFVAKDRLASVGADGTLRIWSLPDQNPYAQAQAQPTPACARCATPADWLAEARRRLPRDFSADERRRFGIEAGG